MPIMEDDDVVIVSAPTPMCCVGPCGAKEDLHAMASCFHHVCGECLAGWLVAGEADALVHRERRVLQCPCCKIEQNGGTGHVNMTSIGRLVADKRMTAEQALRVDVAYGRANTSRLGSCARPTCKVLLAVESRGMKGSPGEFRHACPDPDCGLDQCWKCGVPWTKEHDGVSCKRRLERARMLDGQAMEMVHPCPGCGHGIQKRDPESVVECNHIRCSQCRTDVCALCGGRYASGHYWQRGTPCHQAMFSKRSTWLKRQKRR